MGAQDCTQGAQVRVPKGGQWVMAAQLISNLNVLFQSVKHYNVVHGLDKSPSRSHWCCKD